MFGIKINKKQTWGKVGMKNQESLMFDKPIKKILDQSIKTRKYLAKKTLIKEV